MLNKRILVLMFLLLFLPLVGCLTPPNQAPILTSSPITTATVGVEYTYDVNATDPDGDTLTYSLATPAGMTISSATGLIKWTPVATQVGNNLVTVMVSDGVLYITQSFTIKVSTLPPVNQKPVIYSTPITTATVGVTYFYDVNATDPDGDTLTYSLTTYPSNMTINSATGVISWIPTLAQVGYNSVTVMVSDGVLYITQSFTIKVSTLPPVNQAPVIYSTPITTATSGISYTYDVDAIDPDGDILAYYLTTWPSGMTIALSTGKITWIPESAESYVVTVKASDGELSDTQGFIINVVAGVATQVRVETVADGSGTVVPAQILASGNSITVYAISRDTQGNFVENVAADSWALTKTGNVVDGDLVPAGDDKSALFTAASDGTAVIDVVEGVLSSTSSGVITVP